MHCSLARIYHQTIYHVNHLLGRNEKDTHGVKALIICGPDVAALGDTHDRALMVQHPYGNRAYWHLPGGQYHPDKETPEQATIREIGEELGVQVKIAGRLRDYTIPKRTNGKKNGAVDVVARLICQPVSPTLDFRRSSEISAIGLFLLAEIEKGQVPSPPITERTTRAYLMGNDPYR